jgi:3-oxoacyl-[acyl-carrier protein] reductase
MDLGLTGKKALVLASSRGLGLGIAEALAAEGVDVLLTGRNEAALEAAAAAITGRGAGKASWTPSDLFAPDVVDRLATAAVSNLGHVDVLVNNTGGPPFGTVASMTEEALATQAQAMVFRIIALANRLIPAMKSNAWGRILTVASSGVVQPIPTIAMSNTLRSALIGWNKTLSGEVAADGITCNVLLPGRIQTDRVDEFDGAAAQRSGKSLEEIRKASRATIPAGRYGTVAEFAATAAFLCSAPASYITGSTIRCDGGAIRSI